MLTEIVMPEEWLPVGLSSGSSVPLSAWVRPTWRGVLLRGPSPGALPPRPPAAGAPPWWAPPPPRPRVASSSPLRCWPPRPPPARPAWGRARGGAGVRAAAARPRCAAARAVCRPSAPCCAASVCVCPRPPAGAGWSRLFPPAARRGVRAVPALDWSSPQSRPTVPAGPGRGPPASLSLRAFFA